METKVLKVRVTERKTADGRQFKSYETFSKNGRATKLKFTKDVANLPQKDCYIVVDVDKMNVSTRDQYPVCWVSKIEEIKEGNAVDVERNRKEVDEYFG